MEKYEKVLYEELKPREFLQRLNQSPIAYLPMGTLEWHGLQLPLGADGLQSLGFFKKLAIRIGGIILPMLFVGPDGGYEDVKDDKRYFGMDITSFEEDYPQQLEGSAYYIEEDLFGQLLETILRNLARAGFKIVVAHGHGPSTDFFREHKEVYEKKFDLKLFDLYFFDEELVRNNYVFQSDHAAFNETSITMALRPELVDMSEIKHDQYPIGVWGEDPRIRASVEAGNEIIEKNLDKAEKILISEIARIRKEERKINFYHVKNLLELK